MTEEARILEGKHSTTRNISSQAMNEVAQSPQAEAEEEEEKKSQELGIGTKSSGLVMKNQRGSTLLLYFPGAGVVSGWFTTAVGKTQGEWKAVHGTITEYNTITFNVSFHPVDSLTTWIGYLNNGTIDTTWILKHGSNEFDSQLIGHDLFKGVPFEGLPADIKQDFDKQAEEEKKADDKELHQITSQGSLVVLDNIQAIIAAIQYLDQILPPKIKQGLIEWIKGHRRWRPIAYFEQSELGHYAFVSEIRKDIYPVFGPKHIKMYMKVYCVDKNDQCHEKEFLSEEGHYWDEVMRNVYPYAKAWIETTSGKPVQKQWHRV